MNIYIYFLLFSDIMGERLALEERRVVASLISVSFSNHSPQEVPRSILTRPN
jgi:hypothetical protein